MVFHDVANPPCISVFSRDDTTPVIPEARAVPSPLVIPEDREAGYPGSRERHRPQRQDERGLWIPARAPRQQPGRLAGMTREQEPLVQIDGKKQILVCASAFRDGAHRKNPVPWIQWIPWLFMCWSSRKPAHFPPLVIPDGAERRSGVHSSVIPEAREAGYPGSRRK